LFNSRRNPGGDLRDPDQNLKGDGLFIWELACATTKNRGTIYVGNIWRLIPIENINGK
jgi:hypothetical protein